jgi:hypothetical protein
MNYKIHLNNFEHYEKQKKEQKSSKGLSNPYKYLPSSFITTLADDLSKITLVRNEAGLIDARVTISAAAENLRTAAQIAYSTPRSQILGCSAANNAEFASLTPLLMYAHKRDHGVMYEEWDKGPDVRFALGKFLQKMLYESSFAPRNMPLEDVARVRKEFLNGNKATGYSAKSVGYEWFEDGEEYKFSFSSTGTVSKILLQTWIAHSTLRVPSAMILDPFNWDNTPEAFDFEVDVAAKTELVFDSVEDTPW